MSEIDLKYEKKNHLKSLKIKVESTADFSHQPFVYKTNTALYLPSRLSARSSNKYHEEMYLDFENILRENHSQDYFVGAVFKIYQNKKLNDN